MRVAFDTNVIISALLLPNSKPRKALDKVLDHGVLLVSFETLIELQQVLGRAKFHRYITEEDIRIFLAALIRKAELVGVSASISVCRDSKDNKFLELAVSGSATHLVTGDADLRILHPFQSIQIISPDEFLLT